MPRTATVLATTPLVALRVSKDGFFNLVTQFPQVGVEVMHELASRLHQTTQRLTEASRRLREARAWPTEPMPAPATPGTGRRGAAPRWTGWSARPQGQPFLDNLFAELCQRLRAGGPAARRARPCTCAPCIRSFRARACSGGRAWPKPELSLLEHGIFDDPRFVNSPVRALYEGADGFRQRLDLPARRRRRRVRRSTPICASRGLHRLCGPADAVHRRQAPRHQLEHATGPAASRPTTWSRSTTCCRSWPLAVEIRSNRRITKNLLNTYVGQHAGERILSGDIRRGSGATVQAAIWNCDLRGFTRISEQWPRDDVIQWLNEYFDVMAAPVEKHGGEILKFVGDGMLAIFPLEKPEACNKALQAAVEARRGMRELNARRIERGSFELGFGVALHVGDVMYGNIGTDHPPRLHRDRPRGQRRPPACRP